MMTRRGQGNVPHTMSQATRQYEAKVQALQKAEAEIERLKAAIESQKDQWLSWEAKRVALEKDAARWMEFSKGEPLTVKMKKSTVVFGPNPEREYAEALSTAIDKAMEAK